MKKNKLHICFYGHLRTFKRTLGVYRKYFKNYNVNYHMVTWDMTFPKHSSWHSFDSSPKKVSSHDIAYIKKKLPNVNLTVLNQLDFLIQNKINPNRLNQEKIFTIINRMQKLLFQKINSTGPDDIIIMTRPDIWFSREVADSLLSDKYEFFLFANEIDNNKNKVLKACDAFNASRYQVMKNKINFFDSFEDEFSKFKGPNWGIYSRFFDEYKIKPVRIIKSFSIKWKILRPRLGFIAEILRRMK